MNLLKSKIREKLLVYYFIHPGVQNYIRELSRIIKEDPSNILKELKKFENEGLFLSERKGKERFFKLNKNFSLYEEYKNIVSKTVGIEHELIKIFREIKNIETAFIYGSYANGKDKAGSDIDLFIISDKVKPEIFLDKINILEKKIDRDINYRVFSEDDFKKLIKEKNSFIVNILKNKKIFLIGDI